MRLWPAWLGQLFTRQRPDGEQQNRLAGEQFQVIIDGNPVSFPTSIYRGGMSIPGAWRAASLLSGLLGQVPWDAYRNRGGDPVVRIDPTPLLLDQPYPPDTRMTTFSSWALDLIWHGNAFGVIAARNSDGVPIAAVPVPAEQVGVRYVSRRSVTPLNAGPVEYNVGSMIFAPDEVIHIKGPCQPGALRGFGVLEAHLDGSLNLAQSQAEQAGALSQHGVPTGVLQSDNPDLTQDEANKLKTNWLTSQQTRTISVLNATTHFQPLSWNPEQMQLVEARRFTLTELELIFGLPVGWLGGMNSARQYSNIEQDAVNLLKFSMSEHLARFEQTLSAIYPRGTTVKAQLDAILRADTLTRYQAYRIALDPAAPWLTVDEVREQEDRPPMPEPPPTPIPEPIPALDGPVPADNGGQTA